MKCLSTPFEYLLIDKMIDANASIDSPSCPCGTENISPSQCMWDAGILNGGHGRELLRLVTFQSLQRGVGNGQGTERHTLVERRGKSPSRCLLDDSGLEGGNLITFDGGLFLMTAAAILAVVLLILGHVCDEEWLASYAGGLLALAVGALTLCYYCSLLFRFGSS